jgi:pilus assembly protein Flp/PilA
MHGGMDMVEGTSTMKTFIKMMKDESGASAAEYALILAIVGTAIALAALYLGNQIAYAINSAGDCINNPSSGTC